MPDDWPGHVDPPWARVPHEIAENHCYPAGHPYWSCLDCGIDTRGEYFCVHWDVWLQAAGGPDGKLCVGCLETRLHRRLVPADFPPVNANDPAWRKTPRLLDRMTNA